MTPFALLALVLFGHWMSERPQVATINRSLDATKHDLRGVATVVHEEPAEARGFVCCGDGGPSGSVILRGNGDVSRTTQAIRKALIARGWTLSTPDGEWFEASRGSLTVEINVFTITDGSLDPDFSAGQTQVFVTSR